MRSEYIRSTHPVGPPVPKLPLLGTTWYRRGVGYWLRRAGVVLFVLLILAIFGLYVGAVFDAIATSLHGAARVVLLGLATGTVIASVIAAVRQQRRYTAWRAPRSATAGGLGAGVSARGGSPLAGAFLIVVALVGIGWPLLWLVMSCRRYSGPAEVAAVQGVAQWKAQHPDWRP
ncbi:MAG: hypothetical protein H7146_09210 [Burkholderiaceae bacterium]|nr:hypothetical protein [Microbacteriaceae bacterium]